jgi:hypothetical protein
MLLLLALLYVVHMHLLPFYCSVLLLMDRKATKA